MFVECPRCGKTIRVATGSEPQADRKAKCVGCRELFRIADAREVAEGAAATRTTTGRIPVLKAPPDSSDAGASPPPDSQRLSVPGRPTGRSRALTANWKVCSNHPDARSEFVCESCGNGWCPACPRVVNSIRTCPACDRPCVAAAEREESERKARLRARPMWNEIGTILRYPFTDVGAYVILSILVGGFAAARLVGGGVYASIFSKGLLMAYALTALTRVATGRLSGFMPDISNFEDLIEPLRLGAAAFLVSAGPLCVILITHPEVTRVDLPSRPAIKRPVKAHSPVAPRPAPASPADGAVSEGETGDEPSGAEASPATTEAGPDLQQLVDQTLVQMERGEEAPPTPESVPAVTRLLALAFLVWYVAYSPVALMAAAMSRSFYGTIDPRPGVAAIAQMGTTYWQATALYVGITAVQFVAGGILALVPVAGQFVGGFVDAYASLCVGCALGLALFKKSAELGLD